MFTALIISHRRRAMRKWLYVSASSFLWGTLLAILVKSLVHRPSDMVIMALMVLRMGGTLLYVVLLIFGKWYRRDYFLSFLVWLISLVFFILVVG